MKTFLISLVIVGVFTPSILAADPVPKLIIKGSFELGNDPLPHAPGTETNGAPPAAQETDQGEAGEVHGPPPAAGDVAVAESVQADGREYVNGKLVVPRTVAVAFEVEDETIDGEIESIIEQLENDLGFEYIGSFVRRQCPEPGYDGDGFCPFPDVDFCSYPLQGALFYRIPAGMSVSEAISLVGGRFFPEVTWVTHVYPYNPYYVYFRESCYTDPGEPWYWLSAEDPNYDGRTNILDLVFIRNRTGQDPSSGDNWQADLNHDGEINIRDMIRAFNHFNEDWRDWAWEAITGESGLPRVCDDSLTN